LSKKSNNAKKKKRVEINKKSSIFSKKIKKKTNATLTLTIIVNLLN